MSNWYNYTVALGASGPQICDSYSGTTTATRCSANGSNCKSPYDDHCYPSYIWAQQSGSTNAYRSYLYDDSWTWNSMYVASDKRVAYSVRCVTAIEY